MAVKKKRVSKKTKSSWRKHVDVNDVENYLEDVRLEERLGKPFSERTDNELFTIDSKPISTQAITRNQKRRLELALIPRCFQLLVPHTNVPDPITKRNRVRTPDERKHPILRKKEQIRKTKGILKPKEISAIKTRKLAKQKKAAEKIKRGEFKKDIWGMEGLTDNVLQDEWINYDTKLHTLANSGKPKKKLPASVHKKPSILMSIEPPHPGMSYNPSLKDHQELLGLIAEKETEIIKEEKHLSRVTTNMFLKSSAIDQQNAWMVEMSQGLPSTKNETSEDSENDDTEVRSINPPVKNRKKELRQRKKQLARRKLEAEKKLEREEKKKIADIYKLKFIQKKLENEEKHLAKVKEKREKIKISKAAEPKRLGRKKFESSDLEFNIGEDISGNLRNLKSEGNLLMDRFKSLQKRNILVPSEKHIAKKAKIKRFEKASHKMGWESKGY